MSTEDNIRAAARITAEIRAKEREAIEGLIQTWTCGPQPARVGDLFEAIRARGQASEAHDTADEAENERVKAERDALRLRFQAVAELVVTLDDAVQRGAGCCEAGRGSRLRQIRAEVEKTERADWAPSFEDRISEAWTERDALKAALEVERHNHQQALDACDALLAERDAALKQVAGLEAALEEIANLNVCDDANSIAREALVKVAP